MRPNIKKGVLRLYFLIWAIWAIALSYEYAQNYREFKNYKEWTIEKASAEAKKRCAAHLKKYGVEKYEDLPPSSYFSNEHDKAINCISVPMPYLFPPEQFSFIDYIKITFMLPFVILILIYVSVISVRWVIRGFFEKK